MYQKMIDQLTPIVNSMSTHSNINQRARNAQEYPSAQLCHKCEDLDSIVILLNSVVQILERLAQKERKGLLL